MYALTHGRQWAKALTACRGQPISKGNLSTVATCIAVTMASRLVLNLRRSAARGAARPMPFSAPSSHGIPGVGVGRNQGTRVDVLPVFADAEAGPVLDIRAASDSVGAAEDDWRADDLWRTEEGGEGRQWPSRRTGNDIELKTLK